MNNEEARHQLEARLSSGELSIEDYSFILAQMVGSDSSSPLVSPSEGIQSVGDLPTGPVEDFAPLDIDHSDADRDANQGAARPTNDAPPIDIDANDFEPAQSHHEDQAGSARPSVGQKLGNYLLEKRVARGGMGEIWRAWDQVGERPVALKFLPPELIDRAEELVQLKRAFERVQQLQHQHICPIYHLGQSPGVGYFLVMKFLESLTLGAYRRFYIDTHENMSIAEVARILHCIAAALDYSHQQGIVHRDVKPQNVMVSRDGKDVQLVDFDLAATVHSSVGERTNARSSQRSGSEGNQIISPSGTFSYMSPEQWLGQPLDGRSDQYSLGIVAYEMIAGRLPFESSDPFVLRQCTLDDAVPPIEGIEYSLFSVIQQALQSAPDSRFPSCQHFTSALQEQVAGNAGSTDQPLTFRKKQSWVANRSAGTDASQNESGTSTSQDSNSIPTFRGKRQSSTRRRSSLETMSSSASKLTADAQGLLRRAAARALQVDESMIDIASLSEQRHLDFTGEPLTDLRVATICRSLSRLDVSDTPLTDITQLIKLKQLRELDMRRTQVTSLLPLKHLTRLERLSLDRSPVTDLSPLRMLESLNYLSLQNTPIDRISALSFLLKLRILDLTGTSIGDIAAMAKLAGMRSLSLSRTPVNSIAPLAGLRSLKALNLNKVGVHDFEPLSELRKLKQLSLKQALFRDCRVLEKLANLELLSLAGTEVDSIAELRGLRHLRQLDLSETAITNVESLEDQQQLQWLSLQETMVTDLRPLGSLRSLSYLNLTGTDVSRSQVASLRGALPRLRIVND